MNGFNLISSNTIIGELFTDFNITNTDWVASAQRHLARGLAIMKLSKFYELSFSFKTIREYNAELPCDLRYLLTVLVYDEGSIWRLPLTGSSSLGVLFKDLNPHNIYQGAVNYNSLRTNIEEANIIYVYHRIPKDEEGNLLIPNQEDVLEALPYFVIAKLSLSGYKHPVISREEAEAKWAALYPRARNVVNFMSIEQRDRFSKMYNNPLFVDIINEDWVVDRLKEYGYTGTYTIKDFVESINRLTTADQWDTIQW